MRPGGVSSVDAGAPTAGTPTAPDQFSAASHTPGTSSAPPAMAASTTAETGSHRTTTDPTTPPPGPHRTASHRTASHRTAGSRSGGSSRRSGRGGTSRRRRWGVWVAVVAALLAGWGVYAASLTVIGRSGTGQQTGTAPEATVQIGCQTAPITITPAYRQDFAPATGFDIPILGFDLTGLTAGCLGTGTEAEPRDAYTVIMAVQLPGEGFRDLANPLNLATATPVPGSTSPAYRIDPTGITAPESVTITAYSLRLSGGTAPGAPTLSAVTPGNTTATLTWTAPDSAGSTALTGYQYTLNGGTTWTTATGASPLTITGLGNNLTYTVAVRAVNATGPGPASNTIAVTPLASDEDVAPDVVIAGNQTGLS